jgi:hypothetical protein
LIPFRGLQHHIQSIESIYRKDDRIEKPAVDKCIGGAEGRKKTNLVYAAGWPLFA